jgi:hypothetical protein
MVCLYPLVRRTLGDIIMLEIGPIICYSCSVAMCACVIMLIVYIFSCSVFLYRTSLSTHSRFFCSGTVVTSLPDTSADRTLLMASSSICVLVSTVDVPM